MTAKEKAKVLSGKHARHLKGIAITVGNGVTWKRIVSQRPMPRVVKAKVLAVSMKRRQVDQKNTSVGGFGFCSFGNSHHIDWKCTIFQSDVHFGQWCGSVCSTVAPESFGDDYPMQIEEPKTATGEPVQDEGFRVLPNVTEEGLYRCVNFRVAFVHKALVSASKVCRKGYRIILDSEPGQSGMLHKHTNEWIGLREERGIYVFDSWISPATTAGRKMSEVFRLTPYEHNVDVTLVDFPRQENHP